MDFYAVLDQVVDLLHRRGRVTYGALKLQFGLNDEQLAVLKEELIDAQRLARDEQSRILVWTGEANVPVPTTPAAPQPEAGKAPHSSPLPEGEGTKPEAQDNKPPTPDAERRQLTVLFCDLVNSTQLASQLDPEDLREVVRAYQATCAEVIQRFEGHIAQYLGDGLLVYFGYPQAHEDDAQRAVRTGLEIVEAMGTLNARLAHDTDIRLAVRLGIHTGVVMVGEVGGGGRQEQLALGDTPNIAARLQSLAAPDTVLISAVTYGLMQGYFACHALGTQELKGVAQPLSVYRVLHESGLQTRLDVAAARGLTPLVGRDAEVALLRERWAQVTEGQGQVIVLTGEAGIGKSRLLQSLKDAVAHDAHTRWECRCLPYYQHTALYPLIDLWHRALHWPQHASPAEKLATLEQALRQYRPPLAETVPLLAQVLSLPVPEERYPPLTLSPQRQKHKTLETLLAMVLEVAEQQPVLLIVEDLHWVDPTTLEWLSLVIDQAPTTALGVLATCRPEFQVPWRSRSYLTQLTLRHLARPHVEQLIGQVTGGKTLPAEVMRHLVEKTDGVPLFVEELTKTVLESGLLTAREEQYTLTGPVAAMAIPTTLHDLLMARLDRLATVKGVAQLGATLGREFAYALLQAVAPLDAATLQQALQRLVEAELLYQRGVPPQATYLFKHALIQEAAYQSLLKSTRQQFHQRIAQVLEAQFPDIAETQPELLAHHYTEAGLSAPAVVYWQRAGERALQRSAHVEAIGHLSKGLEVLQALPDTLERTRQELLLRTTLGPALMAAKGYAAPEVEHAYARACALCQQIGDTPQFFPVLRGLLQFYLLRAELQTARELGEQLLGLAQQAHDPALLLEAHTALGSTLNYMGELAAAQVHLEQGIVLYNRQQHRTHALLYGQDTGVTCLSFAALTLWLLGYPDQALQRSHEALTLAQEVVHPFSLALALFFAAWLHQHRREGPLVLERAEARITLAAEHGFAH